MPAAIGYYTIARAERLRDRAIAFASAQARPGWDHYARGIESELRRAGVTLPGASVHVDSTLPVGGGLSSSASLLTALALALLQLARHPLDRMELARIAQRAEREYAGVQCGIMDHFAVLFGQAACVLLLDTRTLAWEAIPIGSDLRIVICDSLVRHDLAAAGIYNKRRRECQDGAAVLRERYPAIRALRDATLAQLDACAGALNPVVYRRCRHVITENERVAATAAALRKGNYAGAGSLLNASHVSLRDDYAVTTPELDRLAAIAQALPGSYGSRMTGAGFGGCTVSLVEDTQTEEFCAALVRNYREQTGRDAQIYDGTPVDGAVAYDG